MNTTRPLSGSLTGLLGGLILSSDAVFIRLMNIADSWLIVVLRGLFMWVACLLVWLLWRGSRQMLGTPWPTAKNALPTLFFCLSSACFVNALNRGNVATVLVIISATPFISALVSRLFFQIRLERSILLASLVGILGVAVVMSGHGENESGLANLFALATALSMALAFNFTSRIGGGTAALPSTGAILAAVVVALYTGSDLLESLKMLTAAQWGWSAIEGALIMPLAMGLIALSTRFVSPANVGLFLLLETALAPLWMALFMDEVPTIQAVIGGVIIIITVISQTLYARRQSAVANAASAG